MIFQEVFYAEDGSIVTQSMSYLSSFAAKKRRDLEILRLLVRNTQNKEHVRQTFMDYADKGELVPVALLFLAAPELFLSSYFRTPGVASSSIATLNHVLNSLEKRTDIEEAMLLLVDALAVAGHKFVAYTRLQYSNIPGHTRVESWPHKNKDMFLPALPFELKRHDLDQAYINKVLPSLTTQDADCLNNAIEKKLSSMPTLYGHLEDFIGTPKQGVKIPFQRLPFSLSTNFKGRTRSLTYMAAKGGCGLAFRNSSTNSLRNISTKPTNLGFLFSNPRLFHAIKRLIK